jgi:hypothetical protein
MKKYSGDICIGDLVYRRYSGLINPTNVSFNSNAFLECEYVFSDILNYYLVIAKISTFDNRVMIYVFSEKSFGWAYVTDFVRV